MKGSVVTLGYLGNKQQHWQKESSFTLCHVQSFLQGGKSKRHLGPPQEDFLFYV